MKYCNPTTFGIKSISCLYPVIPDRKVFKDNLQLKIIDIVCFHFSISEKDILSRSQYRECCDARCIAMSLIYKNCNMSKVAIGKTFGRDHSTVIFNIDKCQALIDTDKKFAEKFTVIKERVYNYIISSK